MQVTPFFLVAFLTDAQGPGTIDFTLTRLETDEVIGRWQRRDSFPDRFEVVRASFRIRGCSFPAAGRYELTLLVDGEWVAQRNIDVVQVEGQT